MSNSFGPHGLQHTRLPCPSLSPGVCSNSCPLSLWCYATISTSATPFFSSLRVFSSESALHIRGPQFWSFSFSISPSNEYPGLISFRIEWFDLAVQGTLKSLLTPLVNPIQRDLHSTVCHIHVHHPLLASLCFFQPVLFIHFVCLPWIYYPYPDRSSGFIFPTSLASLCSWCVSPIFSFLYRAESVSSFHYSCESCGRSISGSFQVISFPNLKFFHSTKHALV